MYSYTPEFIGKPNCKIDLYFFPSFNYGNEESVYF